MSRESAGRLRRGAGRLRRGADRMRRSALRHPWLTGLAAAVLLGVAGLVLVLVGRAAVGPRVVTVAEIVLLVLAPSLLFGAVSCAPRTYRAVRGALESRRARLHPQPSGPPIERIAADLRRLLWEHDRLSRSNAYPMRAERTWAVEAAIGDCAGQAARALGLQSWDDPVRGGLHGPELQRLLRNLAAEGLVLPTTVVLLRSDDRS